MKEDDKETPAETDAKDTPKKNDDNSNRKKRLSRKQQKARKKQKQKQDIPQHEEEITSTPPVQPIAVPPLQNQNFDDTYEPTPIPDASKQKGKSLGKWFPTAKIVKCRPVPGQEQQKQKQQKSSTLPKVALVLFYQYVSPLWSEAKVEQLMAYLAKIAEHRQIGGRVRVASEGVNVTLSSIDDQGIDAIQTLHHFTKDLQHFDAKAFAETHFKFISDLDPSRHFTSLKILPVKELVFYGLNNEQAPLDKRGVHLHPKDFHKMLEGSADSQHENETIVVDVRNHYEAVIGRFDGQEHVSDKSHDETKNSDESKKDSTNQAGMDNDQSKKPVTAAEYVDPKMRKSTDFPAWLDKPETKEKLKGKHVLLYCTGGVRCERASAHLNKQFGDKIKGVYQLEGGVEHYLQHFPDGGMWRGKNFVFDKREAFDANNWNGDGGVVPKHKNSKTLLDGVETTCCICDKPWDRYVGKKKCDTCGVPVLMCDSCMSTHNSKKKKESESSSAVDDMVRCPLCKKENVTVKVDDVEYTDNGVTVKGRGKSEKKAASSVLKWGGGHATQKKEKRRFQRKACRFGESCSRSDCFFAHPGRDRKDKAKGATSN